nr:hypothetical protein Iba_chr05cCG15050 [Ipomoea batatas]
MCALCWTDGRTESVVASSTEVGDWREAEGVEAMGRRLCPDGVDDRQRGLRNRPRRVDDMAVPPDLTLRPRDHIQVHVKFVVQSVRRQNIKVHRVSNSGPVGESRRRADSRQELLEFRVDGEILRLVLRIKAVGKGGAVGDSDGVGPGESHHFVEGHSFL